MMHIVIQSCENTLLIMMAFLRLAIVFLKLIHNTMKYLIVFGVHESMTILEFNPLLAVLFQRNLASKKKKKKKKSVSRGIRTRDSRL